MATYSLKAVQKIPTDIETAWAFFSSTANLHAITPGDIGFKIRSKHHGDTMYAGQLIEYTVKPLLGIPMYWMTEITHVMDKQYFIDEQRFGPYALWNHQHHFRVIAGGVEMTDIVHYRLPLWFIGDLLNTLLIKKKLQHIFSFRFQKIEEIFGPWPGK